MKKVAVFILTLLIVTGCVFVGCDGDYHIPSFSEQCVTTEDGFVYYVDKEIGLCILELPDSEEVVIPKTIDEKPVVQLGYEQMGLINITEHYVYAPNVKRVTVQHDLIYAYVNFSILEVLVYKDLVNCYANYDSKILRIQDSKGLHADIDGGSVVELINGEENSSVGNFRVTVIEIPEYVVKIEAGVFDRLRNVTIKTSYESKPDGWEEGWNGSCEVIWGAELD